MEHKEHHRREMLFLIGFLLLFFIIFLIALLASVRRVAIFGLGLPYMVEDLIVLILAFAAIIKVLWHIVLH